MISIVIPTFNEKVNIPELFLRINNTLRSYDYELIIIDDSSPDGTANLAETYYPLYPIKVIRRTGKLGLASAVVTGFNNTKGNIICVLDADLQHPPELLSQLIHNVKDLNYDIAIASRYVKGGSSKGFSFSRSTTSLGAKYLAYMLLERTRITQDCLSGFFCINSKVIQNIALKPIGYKILMEILVKGNYNKVIDIPYTFQERKYGKTKLNKSEIINYLKHLWMLTDKTFIKFMIVGALGVVVNTVSLYLLTNTGLHYVLSSLIAVQLAIVSNFNFNNLWTFKYAERKFDSYIKRFIAFESVNVSVMVLNVLMLIIFVWIGFKLIIANFLAIGLAFILNYKGVRHYVWK